MLTQEQIRNLKPGDTVLVEAEVSSPLKDGAIVTHGCITHARHASRLYPLPSEIVNRQSSIVNKYDPTRLLKKGDKVRVVKRNGRCNGKDGEYLREAFCEVAEDEVPNELVRVFHNSSEYRLDPAYLELVTSVEDLEPYYIATETFDYEIRDANDDPDIGTSLAFHIKFKDPDEGQIMSVKSYYESYVYSYEHAKAAAEAERDRLNAEWRKEHPND